jgi:phage gp16-like protein
VTAAARPAFGADPARRAMLAKVHLARKELGLSEEDYRAVLQRAAGAASAGDLSAAGLDRAIAEFRRLGWQQSPATAGAARKAASFPAARKARSLWISLWQLGVVRSPTEQSLEAFARRQLKVDRLQWADEAQVYRLIEALKAMATRAGWAQDGLVGNGEGPMAAAELVRRLIMRLHALLVEAEPAAPSLDALTRNSGRVCRWENWPMAELYGLARRLAELRRAQEARLMDAAAEDWQP